MTYKEFNKSILQYYLSRTNSFFFTLSVDQYEIESILSLDELTKFPELQNNWGDLICNDADSTPQYIGLLAVQCLAACQMHDDGENPADAYRIRLMQLLNITDKARLQALFMGSEGHLSSQDSLWISAAEYFRDKQSLGLTIPVPGNSAGRFVQYPKFQALLNREDLRSFTEYFSEEFQPKEMLNYDYFRQRLDACLQNVQSTRRAKRILAEENKKDLCFHQVFNFFSRWDGTIYRIQKSHKASGEETARVFDKIRSEKIVLSFHNGCPEFYLIGETNQLVQLTAIFELPHYKYFYNDMLLFNQMDYYDYQFEDSRRLFEGSLCYILLRKQRGSVFRPYIDSISTEYIYISADISLYKLDNVKGDIMGPLHRFIGNPCPVKLKGGLKIDRSNRYLQGFGPSIESEVGCSVIHSNKKIVYQPDTAGPGIYKARFDYYNDIEFTICPASTGRPIVLSRKEGWNLTSMSIEKEFHLEGAEFKFEMRNNGSGINDWIQSQLRLRGLLPQSPYRRDGSLFSH